MDILYATDGSEGALAGARFLASLPPCRDCRVHIVYVLGHEWEEEIAVAALDAAAGALGSFPTCVTTEICREGLSASETAEQILRAAEALPAYLIVVGTHGLSAVARFLLGSVAEAVARHAPCPVLLARLGRGGVERVLVGVDGSEHAAYAARWLLALPLPPASEIRFVRVVPPPRFLGYPEPALAPILSEQAAEDLEREEERAGRALSEVAAALRDGDAPGWKIVTDVAASGSPAVGLLDRARDCDADLIVVGSHGRSAMGRFLLGSVSEKVLRHAPCSVLVVKRPQAELKRTGGISP